MLAWRPSWISVHCVALMFFIFIFVNSLYLIPYNLGVDTKMNILGAFIPELRAIINVLGAPGDHFGFLLFVTLCLTF